MEFGSKIQKIDREVCVLFIAPVPDNRVNSVFILDSFMILSCVKVVFCFGRSDNLLP